MSESTEKHDVLIIGAGVIGLSCAYSLQAAGRQVTILDGQDVGAGASSGNCGLISPSHIEPLSQPGVLWQATKWMLQPDAPFHIQPGQVLANPGWFAGFTGQSLSSDRRRRAREARHAILSRSRRLYAERRETLLAETEWEEEGALFIFRDADKLAACRRASEASGLTDLVETEWLDGEALVALEPALAAGLAGAYFCPHDAHLRPEKLLAALRASVESNGGRLLLGEAGRVTAIESGAASPQLRTAVGQSHSAEHLVVCTGSLTSSLLAGVGGRKRILPGKGYSITVARPANCPVIPCLFQETKCVVTPWTSGYRIGSTMEFAGFDATLNPRRLQALRDGIRPYLKPPYPADGGEEWCGWRPMTADGVPIIGPLPSAPRVIVAAGHNMLGVSMSPATGELVAALISGADPVIPPAYYAVR